jgi:YD repeat-containing protein
MLMMRYFKRISPSSLIILLAITTVGIWAIKATLAANGSVAYTYDALGRVTTASYDTGVCVIYTYDPNGNRLSETVLVSASGSPGVWGCFNWGERNWGP